MAPFHTQSTTKKLHQAERDKAAETAAAVYLTWEDSGVDTNMIAGPKLSWHRESDDEPPPAIQTREELREMDAAGLESVLDLRRAADR